jgi:hypothetical protein
MNPDDVLKNKYSDWTTIVKLMETVMGENWKTEIGVQETDWEDVGNFQFNSGSQKARLIFGNIEAEIDLSDPTATGLAVISAFTKSVLSD